MHWATLGELAMRLGGKVKYKQWLIGLLGLAVIVVGIALALDWASSETSKSSAQVGSTEISDTPEPPGESGQSAPNSELPNATGPTNGGVSSKESDGKDGKSTHSTSSEPSTSSKTPLLEVPDPTAAPSDGLPKSVARKPLLNEAPVSGVAQGELTKGFPTKQLPLPNKTTVVQSVVTTQDNRVLAQVSGRTQENLKATLAFYRDYYEQLNWEIEESLLSDGTTRLFGKFAEDSTTVEIRTLPTGLTDIRLSGSYKVGK